MLGVSLVNYVPIVMKYSLNLSLLISANNKHLGKREDECHIRD